jgi:peroxiredoxin
LDRIEAKGGRVIALSAGSAREASELATQLGVAFPLLPDTDLVITKAYGVQEAGKPHPRPATFVLDENRKVVYRHVGTSAADRPPLDEILAAL